MRNVGVDVERLKAVLAAEISGALARSHLSVRQAQVKTGIAAADFSRIRSRDLGRFTVDRLMSIINRLGTRIQIAVTLAQLEPTDSQLPAEPSSPELPSEPERREAPVNRSP